MTKLISKRGRGPIAATTHRLGRQQIADMPNISSAYKQILRNQVGEITYRREYQCEFV